MRALAAAIVLILLSGCDRRPDNGPVVASVIGGEPRFSRDVPKTESDRVLTGALASGLVRFDAAGQVEPGLAERWIVIDGGLRYIFRLRDAVWDDGKPVSTAQVVTILKRRLRDPANPLAPFLTAIDDVVEMTPQVLEVRLDRPRPDLLKLFAQPELAIARRVPPGGGGPFRLLASSRPLRLTPLREPDQDEDAMPRAEDDVILRGESAARAVARFQLRESDLVVGGTFDDWPVVLAAGIAPANYRVDPAAGLFGLAVARRAGLLADSEGRAAVAAAIDRSAIVGSLAPSAAVAEALLPRSAQFGNDAGAACLGLTSRPVGTPGGRRTLCRRISPAHRHPSPPRHRNARGAGRRDALPPTSQRARHDRGRGRAVTQ